MFLHNSKGKEKELSKGFLREIEAKPLASERDRLCLCSGRCALI